jgi:hypothetical protein
MKKSLFAVLFAGGLTVLSSQAKAHDGCYDDGHRYERAGRYGYREVSRYDHHRYDYDDDVVIVRPRHRVVVEDDYRYRRPRYAERRHDSLLSIFFGF